MKKRSEYGGAALEYIIVSAFAGVLSLAAIAYVGNLAKDKIAQLNEKLDLDQDIDLGPLEELDL